MIMLNKYKDSSLLTLNNFLDLNTSVVNNTFRLKSLFNHSKRLIRALLLIHFYIYCIFPFSAILYRGSARYHIKLKSFLLILSDGKCLDSYFRE